MTQKHDVFISYAHADKATADTICHFLEAEGVRCWIAPRDIPAGGKWPAHIPPAIEASRLMVLVFSNNANTSEFVQQEVTLASNVRLPLIPFRVENVSPEGDLKFHLVNKHWLDALTPPLAGHVRSLVGRVFEVLGTAPAGGGAPEPGAVPPPRRHRPTATAPRREAPQWHYADGDRTAGPVPLDELTARITTETEVWRPGMDTWLPAGQVPELSGCVHPPEQKADPAPSPPKRDSDPAPGEERSFAGIEFCWCPPGKFMMGSPRTEPGRESREGPQHLVTFARGFWMGKYPVTQAEWKRVMGSNPSKFTGDDRLPVEMVSWDDCQEYLARLNLLGEGVCSLPSEAAWEYACRAGTITPFHFGETISTDQANYNGNDTYGPGKKGLYREKTTPAGSFPANPWGLHDMHGNVWEWCQDWFHDSYQGAPADGTAWDTPQMEAGWFGPKQKYPSRVLRGGSWYLRPGLCRAAFRFNFIPDIRIAFIGFRLLRTP